jgi:hypothetical protein
MIAEGDPFDASSRPPSASFAPGSHASNAKAAKKPSPTILPFALPNKQFVSDTLLQKAKRFLGSESSYRNAVRHPAGAIVYDDRQQNKMAQQAAAFAHSTLWGWLGWLGKLNQTRRAACQLIRQKEPQNEIHRELIPIDPKKYRSEARRLALEQAAHLLLVESMFETVLGEKMFPNFGTGHRWK